jgi:hypothetical protein
VAVPKIPHADPKLSFQGSQYNPDAFKKVHASQGVAENLRPKSSDRPTDTHGNWRCSSSFENLSARLSVLLNQGQKQSALNMLTNCILIRYRGGRVSADVLPQYRRLIQLYDNFASIPMTEDGRGWFVHWSDGVGFALSKAAGAGAVDAAVAAAERAAEPTYEEWKHNKPLVDTGAGSELDFVNPATLVGYKSQLDEEVRAAREAAAAAAAAAANQLAIAKAAAEYGASVSPPRGADSSNGSEYGSAHAKEPKGRNKGKGGRRTLRRKNGRRRTQKKRKTYV